MTPPSVSSQTALQKQIDSLGERMDRGFQEIKDLISGNETRLRALEQREAGCQPIINARVAATEKAIEELRVANELQRKTNAELKELISGLQSRMSLIMWVFGLAGGAVLTWLVAKLLGLIA